MDTTYDYTLFLSKLVALGLIAGTILVVLVGLWLDRDKTTKQPKPSDSRFRDWRDL